MTVKSAPHRPFFKIGGVHKAHVDFSEIPRRACWIGPGRCDADEFLPVSTQVSACSVPKAGTAWKFASDLW